jgi:hypothetical protein
MSPPSLWSKNKQSRLYGVISQKTERLLMFSLGVNKVNRRQSVSLGIFSVLRCMSYRTRYLPVES